MAFVLVLVLSLFRIDIALVSVECLGGSRLCLEMRSLLLQEQPNIQIQCNVSMKLGMWNESLGFCSWGDVAWEAGTPVVMLSVLI